MFFSYIMYWWVESDFKAPNLPLSLRFKGSEMILFCPFSLGQCVCLYFDLRIIMLWMRFKTSACAHIWKLIFFTYDKSCYQIVAPISAHGLISLWHFGVYVWVKLTLLLAKWSFGIVKNGKLRTYFIIYSNIYEKEPYILSKRKKFSQY
jgi:hypothetical protein